MATKQTITDYPADWPANLDDDALRAAYREYGPEAEWIEGGQPIDIRDEIHRRVLHLGLTWRLYQAAYGADYDAQHSTLDAMELLDMPMSAATNRLGEIYEEQLQRWLDGVDIFVTASEAAQILGLATSNAANDALQRWGVRPIGRTPGRGGQNIYARESVLTAAADRPGRGARTDLATPSS